MNFSASSLGPLSDATRLTPAMLLQAATSPLQNPLFPIVLMVVIFYLVLFLPMRRRQKKVDTMLSNLKNGDRVITSGGLFGTIVSVGEDNSVTIRVKPDNIKLQLARSAVTGLLDQEQEQK